MRFRRSQCALWLTITIGIAGCIPSEAPQDTESFKPIESSQVELPPPQQTVASPEELVAQLTALAKAITKEELLAGGEGVRLAGQLAVVGETSLSPVIDLLNAPECGPLCQVYVEARTIPFITKAYTGQLLSLLANPKDDTSRSCVVELLGSIRDDDRIAEALRPLTDHADKRVKLAALAGLATNQGDAAARSAVAEMYHATDSSSADRQKILSVLLVAPVEEDVPLFTEALLDKETDPLVRIQLAMNLGRLGDLETAVALERSAELSEDKQYQSFARSAAENIKATKGSVE